MVNKDHSQEGWTGIISLLVMISSVYKFYCILIAGNEPLTAEGSLDREVSMSKFEKVAQEQDNVLLFSLHDCLSR